MATFEPLLRTRRYDRNRTGRDLCRCVRFDVKADEYYELLYVQTEPRVRTRVGWSRR